GSAGIGTPPHAFGELFKMLAHVDMVHVPYKGSYVPDLLSGQLQVVFAPIPTVVAHIRSGKLRALAVTSTKRSAGAPSKTPPEIINTLNKTINAVITDPATKEKLVNLGIEPITMTPAQYGKLIADETEKWGKVVAAAHMTID